MTALDLAPPGLVVNSMEGDPDECRAGGFLAWDGRLEGLQAALMGVPFEPPRWSAPGRAMAPTRCANPSCFYTNYSSLDRRSMTGFRPPISATSRWC